MTSYLNRLKSELGNLRAERELALMGNDFAMTDGTIRSIDREIGRLSCLIRDEENARLEAA